MTPISTKITPAAFIHRATADCPLSAIFAIPLHGSGKVIVNVDP